jgi:hypothetical protein
MKKLITFYPIENIPPYIESPTPASLFIPDWYKKMPKNIGEEKESGLSPYNPTATNTTMKACSPFLDSLTTGYIASLTCDMEIRKMENGNHIRWRLPDTLVTTHSTDQHPGLPTPHESTFDNVFKWVNFFTIKTPPGYSCLFTHPFNRWDLPFRTFTGVVDTDSYKGTVQFPFQVNKFDEPFIILKKGTPLVQILPFKRDNWKSSQLPFSQDTADSANFDQLSGIVRNYKTKFWSKKIYS